MWYDLGYVVVCVCVGVDLGPFSVILCIVVGRNTHGLDVTPSSMWGVLLRVCVESMCVRNSWSTQCHSLVVGRNMHGLDVTSGIVCVGGYDSWYVWRVHVCVGEELVHSAFSDSGEKLALGRI